jgi:hypothetical protein
MNEESPSVMVIVKCSAYIDEFLDKSSLSVLLNKDIVCKKLYNKISSNKIAQYEKLGNMQTSLLNSYPKNNFDEIKKNIFSIWTFDFSSCKINTIKNLVKAFYQTYKIKIDEKRVFLKELLVPSKYRTRLNELNENETIEHFYKIFIKEKDEVIYSRFVNFVIKEETHKNSDQLEKIDTKWSKLISLLNSQSKYSLENRKLTNIELLRMLNYYYKTAIEKIYKVFHK